MSIGWRWLILRSTIHWSTFEKPVVIFISSIVTSKPLNLAVELSPDIGSHILKWWGASPLRYSDDLLFVLRFCTNFTPFLIWFNIAWHWQLLQCFVVEGCEPSVPRRVFFWTAELYALLLFPELANSWSVPLWR